MTHRAKKPYECKFEACDKSYCDARSLRRHLENVHHHHPADDFNYSDSSNQMFQFGPEYTNRYLNSQEGKNWSADGQSPGYLNSPISPHPNSPGPRGWPNFFE